MKRKLSFIGIAAALCLYTACKKEETQPVQAASKVTVDTAALYVLIDSKSCATAQSRFSSATVDIREIKVKNSEHGWETLTPVAGAWDVVSLQTAPVPVAEITENSSVHTGTITQISLTFGTNNQLVVDGHASDCYKIGAKELVLDVNGEIKAGTLNELVLSIDICGNITGEYRYQQDSCYTLKPVMAFQTFTVR